MYGNCDIEILANLLQYLSIFPFSAFVLSLLLSSMAGCISPALRIFSRQLQRSCLIEYKFRPMEHTFYWSELIFHPLERKIYREKTRIIAAQWWRQYPVDGFLCVLASGRAVIRAR